MLTECRRLLNAARHAVGPGPGSGTALLRGTLSGFSRKWLMATDDADPGTTSRVLARPVAEATKGRMGFTGCGELLAPDSSRDRGIRDIVAGRLRVMIGT
jgi:hypothetical protein